MYRIRRHKGGHYVARDGSKKSYTNKMEYARNYLTREEAEKDLCKENEYIEADLTT